jgi:excisionase family DNA binding protein
MLNILYAVRGKRIRKERCTMRRKNKELNSESSILTADEVAEYLKLSKITVYKLAKDGSLPGFRVGGSWRFSKSNIEKLMS